MFFMISMNQPWNGLAASLISTAIVPPIRSTVLGGFVVLILMNKTRTADAADCTMKYFRLFSRLFFLYIFLIKKREQKASVFISSPIQMAIHEFLVSTTMVDLIKKARNIGEYEILFSH